MQKVLIDWDNISEPFVFIIAAVGCLENLNSENTQEGFRNLLLSMFWQ